jgi:hypothetical protein
MLAVGRAARGRQSPSGPITEQRRLIEIEFTRGDGQHSYLESIADTGICPAGTNAGV